MQDDSVQRMGSTEEEQCKEIYARFGLVMYLAQCIESELAFHLTAKCLPAMLAQRPPLDAALSRKVADMLCRLRSHLDAQHLTGADHGDAMRDIFDETLELFSEKTFGQLLHSLQREFGDPDSVCARLRRVQDKRNWMTHRYFWDRAAEFMTETGRTLMLEELQETICFFREVNEWLESLDRDWLARHGLTDDMIDRCVQRMTYDAGSGA